MEVSAIESSSQVQLDRYSNEENLDCLAALNVMGSIVGASQKEFINDIAFISTQKGSNQELMDILMKYGDNEYKWPPLHYAIYQKDYHAAQVLIENGANPKQEISVSHFNFPAWMIPFLDVSTNKKNKLKIEFKHPTTIFTESDRLFFKSMVDDFEIRSGEHKYGSIVVDFVIKNGWNESLIPFVEDENMLNISLGKAAVYRNYEAMEMLITHGANPSTALANAIRGRHLESMKLLLELDADPNYQNIQYLSLAAQCFFNEEKEEAIRLLLEYGARP